VLIWLLAVLAVFLTLITLLQEHIRILVDRVFRFVEAPLIVVATLLQEAREFMSQHLRRTAQAVSGRTTSLILQSIVAVAAGAFVVVLAAVDVDVTRQTLEVLGFGFLGTAIAVGLIVGILGLGLCLMETLGIHDFGLFADASEASRMLIQRTVKAFLVLAVAAQVAMGAWRAEALSPGGNLNAKYLAELLVNIGLPLLLTAVALLFGWAVPQLAILAALACLGLSVLLLTILLAVIDMLLALIQHLGQIIIAVIDLVAQLGERIWPRSARTGMGRSHAASARVVQATLPRLDALDVPDDDAQTRQE
jgi:hypothetical protein